MPSLLGLWFEENRGQAPSEVRFLARHRDYQIYLTSSEVVLSAAKDPARTVRMVLMGCGSSATIRGRDPLPGRINILHGRDPKGWLTGVPAYERVVYSDICPRVDLVLHGDGTGLEYDFVVRPGGDPSSISLRFEGAESVELEAEDKLVVRAWQVDFIHDQLRAFQEARGARAPVPARYLRRPDGSIGFEIGEYDETRPLVLDPIVEFLSYLGGSDTDEQPSVAAGDDGSMFIAGRTYSVDFPTANALQPDNAGSGYDAFVVRITPQADAFAYATYFGGTDWDAATGIGVDASLAATISGSTFSDDLPLLSPVQDTYLGTGDAFVARLNAAGELLFSTYLGGSSSDAAADVAVTSAGLSYVTGSTVSNDFPVLAAIQDSNHGDIDGFVAAFDPDGNLIFSTYLGGEDRDEPQGIAAHDSEGVCLVGRTESREFPLVDAMQASYPSTFATAFVTKLRGDGSAIEFSTYLGGSGTADAQAVAIDDSGYIYLTGQTLSADFPIVSPVQPGSDSGVGPFVTKLYPDGSGIVYSGVLGGGGVGFGIAVDSGGYAYVVGSTGYDLPQVNPFQQEYGNDPDAPGGRLDGFVAKLAPTGVSLLVSSFLGGRGDDRAYDVDVDGDGYVYVVGQTASSNLPLVDPIQPLAAGSLECFAAKILMAETDFFAVSAVTPDRGGNHGVVSATVLGGGFQQGAEVSLVKGEESIVGDHPLVSPEAGSYIAVSFDLTGRDPGDWDLVVTNPGGDSTTLEGAFTVEEGGEARLWVDIAGRDKIRIGTESVVTLLYGNTGTVDAHSVPFWIGGIPIDAEWSLAVQVQPPDNPPSDPPIDWGEVPIHVEVGDEIFVPLILPLVPAGATGSIPLHITIPDEREFELSVWMNLPIFGSPMRDAASMCFTELIEFVVEQVIDTFLPVNCVGGSISLLSTILLEQTGVSYLGWDGNLHNQKVVLSTSQILVKLVETGLECASFFVPTLRVAAKVVTAISGGLGLAAVLAECSELADLLARRNLRMRGVASLDPNEKVGSPGAGEQRFQALRQPLSYVISFENLAAASAPARVVVVEDQLDRGAVDLDSLQLGPVTVGGRQIDLPPGKTVVEDVDLRPEQDLVLRITVDLNPVTGLLSWRFTSLDPTSLLPPEDPLIGFLPPNQAPPAGEGSALFTIMPKASIHSGDEVRNRALIFFDNNPPIQTGEWLNTIDSLAPVSTVSPLPKKSKPEFEVRWSGSDEGSGIESFTVYVSVDGGEFSPWLRSVDSVSAKYSGKKDKKYAFFATARDRAGNLEIASMQAQAQTQVKSGCGCGLPRAGNGAGSAGLPLLLMAALLCIRRRRVVPGGQHPVGREMPVQ